MSGFVSVQMTPQLEAEVDVLIARLDYLAKLRQARGVAQAQVANSTGMQLEGTDLDRFLDGRMDVKP